MEAGDKGDFLTSMQAYWLLNCASYGKQEAVSKEIFF
jgi:hypothetical protein